MRRQLRSRKELISQIEELNRKIATWEFAAYLRMGIGEKAGFSLFFKERFPESSKRKYDNNIGFMFKAYQNEFEKEEVPKDTIRYYKVEFRTRYRSWDDSYVYPIRIPYIRMEAQYWAKAGICTIREFGVAG